MLVEHKQQRGLALTHLQLHKMAAISQTTFSDSFSGKKFFVNFDENFIEACP